MLGSRPRDDRRQTISRNEEKPRESDRVPITRDLLFRRALEIIDAEGLAALTMRRLAADVGIEAASIYHHLPDKQAVLDGAVSVMREGMVFDEPLPTDWRDLMEVVFLRYLDLLTAHPHLLPYATSRVDADPVDGLGYLVALGMPQEEAVGVWQSILAFVVGFATLATGSIESDVDHLSAGLATRMTHWDRATARRALQAILTSYGPAMPEPGPGSPTS